MTDDRDGLRIDPAHLEMELKTLREMLGDGQGGRQVYVTAIVAYPDAHVDISSSTADYGTVGVSAMTLTCWAKGAWAIANNLTAILTGEVMRGFPQRPER